MLEGFRHRPAREVDAPSLLELTAGLRRTLAERGERLPQSWPEETVAELRAGRMDGIWTEGPEGGRALALFAAQGHRTFAQLHLEAGNAPQELLRAAARALIEALPGSVSRMDLGVTGVSSEIEAAAAGTLTREPGVTALRRFGLVRELRTEAPPEPVPLPEGYRFRPVRAEALRELGTIDWEAFRGGPDEPLIPESEEGNARLLEGILAGQLGRFLDEASTALEDPAGAVAGFVLTVEQSPRSGLIADLAVRPSAQHHGLGRALLHRALRALLALGYGTARLWVTEANRGAHQLYEEAGFRTESTSYVYFWSRGA